MGGDFRDKFKGLRGVRLTHNGMNVSFPDTYEQAIFAIGNHMSCSSVSNKLIVDCEIKLSNDKPAELIIYEYRTLYREVFIVEEL